MVGGAELHKPSFLTASFSWKRMVMDDYCGMEGFLTAM